VEQVPAKSRHISPLLGVSTLTPLPHRVEAGEGAPTGCPGLALGTRARRPSGGGDPSSGLALGPGPSTLRRWSSARDELGSRARVRAVEERAGGDRADAPSGRWGRRYRRREHGHRARARVRRGFAFAPAEAPPGRAPGLTREPPRCASFAPVARRVMPCVFHVEQVSCARSPTLGGEARRAPAWVRRRLRRRPRGRPAVARVAGSAQGAGGLSEVRHREARCRAETGWLDPRFR
jgi:hypothetical protein